jgi:hypothetical protein
LARRSARRRGHKIRAERREQWWVPGTLIYGADRIWGTHSRNGIHMSAGTLKETPDGKAHQKEARSKDAAQDVDAEGPADG